MRCIKCDGTVLSAPKGAGFHCDTCGGGFLDFGRIGGQGQALDLESLPRETTVYRCPVDRENLRRYMIKGLEFEYCPACRHVWLDRREAEDLASKVAVDRASIPLGRDTAGGDSPIVRITVDGDAAGLLIEGLFSLIGAVSDW